MNAHVLFLAALVAVAAARPQEYHDDVFHFSTKVNPENLVRSSVQSVPVLAKAVPQYQQQQVVYQSAPVYSQVQHHQLVQQQPASVLFRSVEQEVPAVSTVHTHHVHQPAVSVYSQVPAVRTVHTHHVHQPAVYSQVAAVAAPVSVSVAAPVVARASFAAPQYSQYSQQYSQYSSAEPKIKILKQVQEFDPAGIYKATYETENGIAASEQGTVKDIQAKEGPVAAKEGSYSYTGPDGVQYTVNWVADEFGFRASGAHLPVAPEVPAEIQRSLQLIASQPQQKYDEQGNLLSQQF